MINIICLWIGRIVLTAITIAIIITLLVLVKKGIKIAWIKYKYTLPGFRKNEDWYQRMKPFYDEAFEYKIERKGSLVKVTRYTCYKNYVQYAMIKKS